jgi:thymidylate kinase
MPDYFETDIDFMVSRDSFACIPAILADIAAETGTQVCQSIDHEVTARAYVLMSVSGRRLTVVQPDCASDYQHFGKRWLLAEEVLGSRRWHPNGFWIPSAAHEFAYCLIKRLNKARFTQQNGYRLHILYLQDRAGCEQILHRYFRPQDAAKIAGMALSDNWSPMLASLPQFRTALMRRQTQSWIEKLFDRLATLPAAIVHTLDRIDRATGLWIAFIGPDGCGKSTVLQSVGRELAPAFREVRTFHLRPRLIGRRHTSAGPVSEPHGRPPRGVWASVAKVLDLVADYLFGYVAWLRPALIRSSLVVFDRCFFDLLVDSRRIRYGGPRWLLQLAARILPQPDLVILLDAPADVLWKRKQEVPFPEVIRQRAAYLELARGRDNTVIVDAARRVDDVVHDTLIAITQHLARRTRLRLHLPAGAESAVPRDILTCGESR